MDYGEERIAWRGQTFNRRSVAALLTVEARLGYQLQILQGSYSTVVSASANTHAGGGAVDCVGRGAWGHEVRVMREVGWVAWHRTPPAFSTEHIHGILRGDPELARQAREQVVEWEHGGDGLIGDSPDTGPSVHVPVFALRIIPPPPGTVPRHQLPGIDLSHVQAAFARGMKGHPSRAVRRVQRALNDKLHAQLLVDGLAGDLTKAAYRAWQLQLHAHDASMPTTGDPDPASLAALGKRRWRVVA